MNITKVYFIIILIMCTIIIICGVKLHKLQSELRGYKNSILETDEQVEGLQEQYSGNQLGGKLTGQVGNFTIMTVFGGCYIRLHNKELHVI